MNTSNIYTIENWREDKTFKAKNYSIIDFEIFNNFLESLPPFFIKDIDTLSDIIEIDTGIAPKSITRAFQNSEPVRHEKNFNGDYIPVYSTFAYVNNYPMYLFTSPKLK